MQHVMINFLFIMLVTDEICGSSQEWRDTGIVQGQQTKLEITVVSEAQVPRFITLIFV